jgi:hypothetical protein
MSYHNPSPRYTSLPRSETLPHRNSAPYSRIGYHPISDDDRHTNNDRRHHHDRPYQYADYAMHTPRVHFARPVVRSISRKPASVEYFFMNLLEHHVERCEACEPMLYEKLPYDCTKGRILEKNILRNMGLTRDGRVCGRNDEWDCEVLVEVSSRYRAVLALLRQVYRPGNYERLHG